MRLYKGVQTKIMHLDLSDCIYCV